MCRVKLPSCWVVMLLRGEAVATMSAAAGRFCWVAVFMAGGYAFGVLRVAARARMPWLAAGAGVGS